MEARELHPEAARGRTGPLSSFPQENFFSEFQMEGVSAENNAIYLELTSENLSRALKTAQNARALKVKLTNKHFPCLTVSIELVSRSGRSRHFPGGRPVPVNLGFPTVWRKPVGFIKRKDVRTNACLLVPQWWCDHIAFG